MGINHLMNSMKFNYLLFLGLVENISISILAVFGSTYNLELENGQQKGGGGVNGSVEFDCTYFLKRETISLSPSTTGKYCSSGKVGVTNLAISTHIQQQNVYSSVCSSLKIEIIRRA